MAKIDKLLSEGEDIMTLAEERFAKDIRRIEKEILKEIAKIFDVVDASGGKLKNTEKAIEFLNSIEKRIDEALKRAGYHSSVNKYLKNFDLIKQNARDLQSALNKVNISATALNDLQRIEVNNTIDKLIGSGISRDFKIPIRESLYRNILTGSTIQETRDFLELSIISTEGADSKLLRYTTQVARDSINQYDGGIQAIIKQELGLPDYIYSGSVIRDSRCQCRYWVEKIKLPADELEGEIDTALRGGYLGGCKCSGMIEGTTVGNFARFRGGYNCRHRAISCNL